MDILLMPKDPSFPVDETPYIATTRWDGGLFLSYAVRTGNVRFVPHEVRNKYPELRSEVPEVHRIVGLQSVREQFLQTWLFFGLIAEFAGSNECEDGFRLMDADEASEELDDIYATHLYLKDGNQFLSGRLVRKNLSEYGHRIHGIVPQADRRKHRIQHLLRCLELVYHVVVGHEFQQTHAIQFSILALAEHLATFLSYVCHCERLHKESSLLRGFAWSKGFFSASIRSRMLEAGWCRSGIRRMESRNYLLTTVHFASRLKMSSSKRDHSKCTDYHCKAAQIDIAAYRPAHALEDCTCEFFDFETQSVTIERILRESDTYPILNLHRSADGKKVFVTVERYDPYVPYVALSHVWADGLGNPFRNELPTCQIQRLERIVSRLQSRPQSNALLARLAAPLRADDRCEAAPYDHGRDGHVTYRLWVDTLCCPVEATGKRIALQRIAEVYRNATHVLVLDSSFSDIQIKDVVGLYEAMLRVVSSSAWVSRLWTFQECALARSLYFQFGDRVVEGGAGLMSLLIHGINLDLRLFLLQADIRFELQALSSLFRDKSESPIAKVGMSLEDLQSSLLHRSVSVPSDEPLCICTLLCLDAQYLLDADDADERIIRLWRLIARKYKGVPASILFHTHRKLEIKGHRWIPKTLLASGEEVQSSLRQNVHSLQLNELVQPTANGLRVVARGYVLSVVPRNSTARSKIWDFLAVLSNKAMPVRNGSTGEIFHLSDAQNPEEMKAIIGTEGMLNQVPVGWSRQENTRIRRFIERGVCAMLADPVSRCDSVDGSTNYLLVACSQKPVRSESSSVPLGGTPIYSHRIRLICKHTINEKNAIVIKKITELATQIAKESLNFNIKSMLVDLAKAAPFMQTKGPQNPKDETIIRVKEIVEAAFESDAAFAQAATFLEYTQWEICANILWGSSYEIIAQPLPDDQSWIVD